MQARLEPGYTAFAKRYRGVHTSQTHRWENKLRHNDKRTTYPYLYNPTGEYFLWRYGIGDSPAHFREWTVHTPDGYHAFLSLLHYLATQTGNARVTLPSDAPLQAFVMDWNLETKVQPVFMGRVVDVEAALRLLGTANAPNGQVRLHITDDTAPWNNGTLSITVEDSRVYVAVDTSSDTPDVSLDIQAFSQAFWGHPSLYDLREAGRLTVSNEPGFALLSAILPAHPVHTLDDF